MPASPDALEGISVCALILSSFASICCGWLVMRFRILEERLQRTLDENGVVRKKFLPGEVFAVPAMAGEASDSRVKETEAKLSAALGDLKAVKQEVQDLEDKLAEMERRISANATVNADRGKFEAKKVESFTHNEPKVAVYMNGTGDDSAVVENGDGSAAPQPVPDVSTKASLASLDIKTVVASLDNTGSDRPAERPQPDSSSQFSIMADIGECIFPRGASSCS
jgi:hypothetical protein